MRRVLMMVFAVAAITGLGTTGAMAQPKTPDKAKKCKVGKASKKGKCVAKPAKPKGCDKGEEKVHGKCVPVCKGDEYRDQDGKCQPKPPVCRDDEINVGGTCVPRPQDGPCAKADLVLLEDLLKGTGALACVYLGDNAPNASADVGGDCPDALLALPLDNLIGACVFLPPADVDRSSTADETAAALPDLAETTAGTELTKAEADNVVKELTSILTGLLGLR